MSRNNISDKEIWSWGGANDKPDAHRFEKGNETGPTALAPKNTDHNYQMNRADQNMQYVLRNATMPWNNGETYPAGARVTLGGKEYECKKTSTNNNPVTSPTYWEWIDNKHLPIATNSIVGISRFATTQEALGASKEYLSVTPFSIHEIVKSRFSNSLYGNNRKDYSPSEYAVNLALDGQTPAKARNLTREDLNTLNDAQHVGFYNQSTNANTPGNNYPVDQAGALFIYKTVLGATNSVVQVYIEWSQHRMFSRAFVSGSWTDWVEYYSSGKKQPFIPAITINNMSGFLGYEPGAHSFSNSSGSSGFPGLYGGGIYMKRDSSGGSSDGGFGFWASNDSKNQKRPAFIAFKSGTPYSDDLFTKAYPPTPSDVGARPDNWMPSASDVGARPDNWMPSASDVGARPDNWMPSASDIGLGDIGKAVTAIDYSESSTTDSEGYKSTLWKSYDDLHGLFTFNSTTGEFTAKIDGYYDVDMTVFRMYQSTSGGDQYGKLTLNGSVIASVETTSNDFGNSTIRIQSHVLMRKGQKLKYLTKGSSLVKGGSCSIKYVRPL